MIILTWHNAPQAAPAEILTWHNAPQAAPAVSTSKGFFLGTVFAGSYFNVETFQGFLIKSIQMSLDILQTRGKISSLHIYFLQSVEITKENYNNNDDLTNNNDNLNAPGPSLNDKDKDEESTNG